MIKVKKFTFNPFQENTYVISNELKACFIVDPGCYTTEEENVLREFIIQNDLKSEAVINTHCHIDHVFGNSFIKKEFGLDPHIHRSELPVLRTVSQVAQLYGLNYTESPDPIFYENDMINLLGKEWKVLFAPGHSPGHIMLYLAEEELLLSGDVIFRMSIGRTDLPGGNHAELLNSIRNEVFTLPEETKIFPGHMEDTTVGFEKKNNPFF